MPPDEHDAAVPPVAAGTVRDQRGPITYTQARRLIFIALAGLVVAAFVVILAGKMVTRLQELLTALAIAIFVSLALEPAVNWLVAHRWKRGWATLTVLFALIAVVLAFMASMVPLIVHQFQLMIGAVPAWVHTLNGHLERWFHFTLSTDWITKEVGKLEGRLATIATDLAQNVWGIGMGVVKLIILGILTLLFTYYLVADAPQLRRAICSTMPRDRQQRVLSLWETAIDKMGGYLYLRLIMAVVAGVGMFLGLIILGVPSPVPLALWMGAFSGFIPTIGVYIGGFVPMLVAFMYDPWDALILLVYVIVYQLLQDYVLGPRITHRTMEINGGISLALVFAGAALFGVVGAFLALPVAAVLQALITSYLTRHAVMDSHLTSDEPWKRPPQDPGKGGGRHGVGERARKLGGRLRHGAGSSDADAAAPSADG
jgi:predicted PurR-regulated permease PerM